MPEHGTPHDPELVRRVAKACQALRPEWAAMSTETQIQTRWAHLSLQDVAMMLFVAAMTPGAGLPRAIDTRGPWQDVVKRLDKAETFTPMATCPDHAGAPLLRCKACQAGGEERKAVAETGAAECRAALKAARDAR